MGTLTLFGSALFFWLSVLIFVVICFIADIVEEGGWAFAGMIVLGILFYLRSDIKPILGIFTLINIFFYILLGFLFTAFRVFFTGRKLWREIKDLPVVDKDSGKYYNSQGYRKDQFVSELSGNVSRWWLMWPVSLLNLLFVDVIKEVWLFTYPRMQRFYTYVLELGMNSAK
jgi:hypothetical protein